MEPGPPPADLEAIVDPRQFPVSTFPLITTLHELIKACGERIDEELLALWRQRLHCDHCGCDKPHGISSDVAAMIELVQFPVGLTIDNYRDKNYRFKSPGWSAHFHLERAGFRSATLPEILAFHARYVEDRDYGILEMGTPIGHSVSYIDRNGVLVPFCYGSMQHPDDKYAAVRLNPE